MRETLGLVLGKFLPPHRGHQFLIDFARHYCDRVIVHVCSVEREPIPGELRYRWMRDAFPMVDVVHHTDEIYQDPTEAPDEATFYATWRRTLLSRMDRAPDVVFASEAYGSPLAACLGARFVPLDINREHVPISATMIRENPMAHWDDILPQARPHFLKRVAIVGPESSGKSTLAPRLAAHFGTRSVAEYGRTYLEALDPTVTYDAIEAIVRGHYATEEAIALQARKVLISDTDALITKLWAEVYLGVVPPLVEEFVRKRTYDLTLVTGPTASFHQDGSRIHEAYADRERFFHRCLEELPKLSREFIVLSGSWEERFAQASRAIEPLFHDAPVGRDARPG